MLRFAKINNLYVATSILLTAFVLGILWLNLKDTVFLSVEFNLSELSPRGEKGGYAMPASGASAPSGLNHSCSYDGTRVTLQWSSAQYIGSPNSGEPYALKPWWGSAFGIQVAHAGGGGDGGGGGPTGPQHNHPVPAAVEYIVRLNGQTIASSISGTSHQVSITPDRSYSWSVQACAGGSCSSERSSSFTCVAPPSLSFTADQYTVPYNTGTTLRWNSNHTNTCTASGAWSGGKSVSGSEATGPLTSQTNYFLQCSGSRGSTSPAAVTIGIIHGTGADISVDCGAQTGNSVTVRKGQICPINWNTGTSAPANCELRAGAVVLSSPLTTQTGTFNWEVFGETTVYLDCEGGNNIDSFDVRILPEFQET